MILLIGDGWAIRNHHRAQCGTGRAFKGLDALPVTGQYTHYALTKDGKPDYVTDSAASGTAWAMGTKSYAPRRDFGRYSRCVPTTSLHQEGRAGYRDVSTAEIQDAMPAVQVAHATGRKC